MKRSITEAQRMDILLELGKVYKLVDTDDPATLRMELGKGYHLLASIRKAWVIVLDDGMHTSTYQIHSERVHYTSAKDARALWEGYLAECKKIDPEYEGEHGNGEPGPVETPEQKAPEPMPEQLKAEPKDEILISKLNAVLRFSKNDTVLEARV